LPKKGRQFKAGLEAASPRAHARAITLTAGKIIDQSIDSECQEVILRGQVRCYADHWSVTLFLVNQQTEPKRRREEAWVFQPELKAVGRMEPRSSRNVLCRR
jgi:hypothetical protein